MSSRYTCEDAARWASLERQDAVYASTARFGRHVERARAWLRGFVYEHPRCYAGVSWGKDSTVLADLVARNVPEVPLVWVRVEPIANPDCALVRDAFLAIHPHIRYEEIETWCSRDECDWHATGTLERGFAEAALRHGAAHISGVRAEESASRRRRMRAFGPNTGSTCAPIGWWLAGDVWSYLYARKLPVHLAYACSGGLWDRDKIRVASIGGQRGRGWGREEWEKRYYAR